MVFGSFKTPSRSWEEIFSLLVFHHSLHKWSSFKPKIYIFDILFIFDYTIRSDDIQSWIQQGNGGFIRGAFQESSRLKKYYGKWYSEDSWSNIIHQNFEITTSLVFTVKDLSTAISKDKNFKHVIQELSYTNQKGIYSLNCYHDRKRVNLFQAAPIGDLLVEIPFLKVEWVGCQGWFPARM